MNFILNYRPSLFIIFFILFTITIPMFVFGAPIPRWVPLGNFIAQVIRPDIVQILFLALAFITFTALTLVYRLAEDPQLLGKSWYIYLFHCIPLLYPRALILNPLYFRLMPSSRKSDVFQVVLGCACFCFPSRVIVALTICLELWQYLINLEVEHKQITRQTLLRTDMDKYIATKVEIKKRLYAHYKNVDPANLDDSLNDYLPVADVATAFRERIAAMQTELTQDTPDILVGHQIDDLMSPAENIYSSFQYESVMILQDCVNHAMTNDHVWHKLGKSIPRGQWDWGIPHEEENHENHYYFIPTPDPEHEGQVLTDSVVWLAQNNRPELYRRAYSPLERAILEWLGYTPWDAVRMRTVGKDEDAKVIVKVLNFDDIKFGWGKTKFAEEVNNFYKNIGQIILAPSNGFVDGIHVIPELYKFLHFKCMLQVYRKTGVQPDEVRATAMAWPKALDYTPERVDVTVDTVIQELIEECEARSFKSDKDYLPCPAYVPLEDRVHYLAKNAQKALTKLRMIKFLHILCALGFLYWIFVIHVPICVYQATLGNDLSDYRMIRILQKTVNLTVRLGLNVGNRTAVVTEELLDRALTLDTHMYCLLKSLTQGTTHLMSQLRWRVLDVCQCTLNLQFMLMDKWNTMRTYGNEFLHGLISKLQRPPTFSGTAINKSNSIMTHPKHFKFLMEQHYKAMVSLRNLTACQKRLEAGGLHTLENVWTCYYLGLWCLPIMILMTGLSIVTTSHNVSIRLCKLGCLVIALWTLCARISLNCKKSQLENLIEEYKLALTPLLQLQDHGTYKSKMWYFTPNSPSSTSHMMNVAQSCINAWTTSGTFLSLIILALNLVISLITCWDASLLSTVNSSLRTFMNRWKISIEILLLITLIAVLRVETVFGPQVTVTHLSETHILTSCLLTLSVAFWAWTGTASSKVMTISLVSMLIMLNVSCGVFELSHVCLDMRLNWKPAAMSWIHSSLAHLTELMQHGKNLSQF